MDKLLPENVLMDLPLDKVAAIIGGYGALIEPLSSAQISGIIDEVLEKNKIAVENALLAVAETHMDDLLTDNVKAAVFGKYTVPEVVGKFEGGYGELIGLYGKDEDALKNIIRSVDFNDPDVANAISEAINAVNQYDSTLLLTTAVKNKFFENIGEIDISKFPISDIVEALGGYNELLTLYTPQDLINIARAVGTERIVTFIKDSGILQKIAIKAKLAEVIDHFKDRKDEIKTLVRATAKKAILMLNTDVDMMWINNKTVFNGQFDLNAILVALLQNLPDINDFLSIGENGTIASYKFEIAFAQDKYPSLPRYTYGIEIGFIGSPEKLQNLIAPYAEHFVFSVSDSLDVDMSVTVPSVVSAVYEKLLVSDKTDAIKEKLLAIPTTSISDVGNIMASFTDEQLQGVVDTVSEKVDEIRAKAYEKVDESAIPDDAAQKAKDGIDKIIDSLLTLERAKQLRDKAVEALDRVPDKIANRTVADFYRGEGNFAFGIQRFSLDLYAAISKVVALPEDVKVYFKDAMVISGSFDVNIKINELSRLTLMNEDGSESVYYLPNGIKLSTLDIGGMMDDELNPVTEMPSEDTYLYSDGLYSVSFKDKDGNDIVD